MRVTITFTTDNDAFTQDLETEIDRTLNRVKNRLYEHVREQVSNSDVEFAIRDTNGNRIGECRIEKE